ncbi:DUF3783 domain-containing protein [Brotaphodocola sp.]|uniref:DUF3783 domain-containing protein n=1 Tax=Brotaphodocola sp. TaxID=3073577 RepID=UPI003D7EC48C
MAVTRGGREMVLYYSPEGNKNAAKLKGVLVRMGVRIRNVSEEQFGDTLGSLIGLEGFEARESAEKSGEAVGAIEREVLVMHNFSGNRIDELLLAMRRANVQKIDLKAIVTESNVNWSFYHLYEEIGAEHERMHQNANAKQ